MEFDRELLKGSINLLILKLLSERDMYGYEIIREAAHRSSDVFQFKEGTLYPALHMLHRRGYLRSEWRTSESGRERKYYGLTIKGRKAAEEGLRSWAFFTGAVNAILTN
jgi:PadR family transcriptional regulator PadR